MTQTPSQPATVVNVAPSPSNGLGVAGFITSIVGFVTCGLLSPIGLLLSVIAMFKRPRGFAIAGLIIGLLGTAFLGLVGAGLIAGWLGVKAAGNAVLVEAARYQIEEVYRNTGALPSDLDGQAAITSPNPPPFGHQPRYERTSDTTYAIIMPGKDGAFGTADDQRNTFTAGAASTTP